MSDLIKDASTCRAVHPCQHDIASISNVTLELTRRTHPNDFLKYYSDRLSRCCSASALS
jgi:hypothetical protein